MKKKIIIGSVIFLLISIISAAAFFFLHMNKSKDDESLDEPIENSSVDNTKESKDNTSPKKIPAKWKDMTPKFEILGSFLVNLKSDTPNSERFAQVDLSVEYFSKNNLDDFKKFQPIIHNDILIYLSQQTPETLLSSEGKALILQEVMIILKKYLTNKDEYYLNNIIFKNFIIQ